MVSAIRVRRIVHSLKRLAALLLDFETGRVLR